MEALLYAKNKTKKDVDRLLLQHKNLVYYMLTSLGQLSNPDAESAAWEALWDAICMFDIYGTSAFSTYACTIIKNAIYLVLRKQKKEKEKLHTYIENFPSCEAVQTDIYYASELELNIARWFTQYIEHKSGATRNVLIVWYSSGFDSSVTNIATICGCSASYVSRVQSHFRAFISDKLKRAN